MSKRRAELRHPDRHRGHRDVVIGYCQPEDIDSRAADALLNMVLHDRDHDDRIHGTIGYESGPRIANARCEIVRRFLEDTTCPWLLWLDRDMTFTVDALDQLLAVADPTERPVVGALCFAGGKTNVVPTIYTIAHNAEGKIESETMLKYPTPELIEVGGTGCAFVLVHRSVFVKVAELFDPEFPLPWYQDCVFDNRDFGEDLVFCMRARAVGARIWIHTGVKTGHRKKHTIDEAMFLAYAARLDAAAEAAGYSENDQLTVETLRSVPLDMAVDVEDRLRTAGVD